MWAMGTAQVEPSNDIERHAYTPAQLLSPLLSSPHVILPLLTTPRHSYAPLLLFSPNLASSYLTLTSPYFNPLFFAMSSVQHVAS